MDNCSTSASIEKCSCDKTDPILENDNNPSESPTSKDKKSNFGFFNLHRGRSLNFASKRTKKATSPTPSTSKNPIKKSPKWKIKFSCTKKESKVAYNQENQNCCTCTCYRKTDENILMVESESIPAAAAEASALITEESQVSNQNAEEAIEVCEAGNNQNGEEPIAQPEVVGPDGIYGTSSVSANFVDVHWLRGEVHEDCDEAARLARAREIEQGVEAPANYRSVRRVQLLCSDMEPDCGQQPVPRRLQLVCPPDLSVDSLRALFQTHVTLKSCPLDSITGCHTQVDFIHCLVPDMLDITNCSFYWGKMDRYEAERLLDGKPEGTFLLRDSAQEEFLFSVSFRKYGRSLHARIEQWNHRFSFDSHDPGVFTSNTVCGLIEHYKDPSSCMFFEPMLTSPLHRNSTFSLQHLTRATIVNRLDYNDINQLQLPKTLKNYLKEYHYRQKVRVERFDNDVQWLELSNTLPSPH